MASIGTRTLLWLMVVLPCLGCKERRSSIVKVYCAASLNQVLTTAKQVLEKQNPRLEIRLEPSGSQIAARKVAELQNPGDVVMVADLRVIESILMPAHAGWMIQFASNEIVLAHRGHSKHTEEVSTSNWPEILLRPGVRLGRVDENTAPIGFQTLLVWKLASERFKSAPGMGDLHARLLAKVRPEQIAPDVEELAALLESKTIDYAFVFKSTAVDHNLKFTLLPAELNLSSTGLKGEYAKVEVPVKLKGSTAPRMVKGAAIVYALTIPGSAPNPDGAMELVRFLLQGEGLALLARSGFLPLPKVACCGTQDLPEKLGKLCEARLGACKG